LLVDDSDRFLGSLQTALAADYETRLAKSLEEARKAFHPPLDAVLLDLRLDERLPDRLDGLEFLKQVVADMPVVPVVIMTAYGDVDTAVKCMQLGAADFIQKGGDIRELKTRLQKVLETAQLSVRVSQLKHDLELVEPRKLVGDSDRMQEVRRLISSAAHDGNITVLIRGETGTGKEVVARAIHATGPRAEMPFIAVDVAGLPEQTLTSELFGHEPGAFTDAKKQHVGYAERAHRGVLFLDEIGDLAPSLQVKFLRFLEEKSFVRLGGTREINVDVQLIAATNANLESLVSARRFREDLLHRLKVYEILLPSLREHAQDIPELCAFFLKSFSKGWKGPMAVSPGALSALASFSWPGNVRQLRNVLEAARLRALQKGHATIDLEDLPSDILEPALNASKPVAGQNKPTGSLDLDLELARSELQIVEKAMLQTNRRKTDAWKLLGLNDRFALRRRVVGIFRRYPSLADEFARLSEDFEEGKGSGNDVAD
jgi:DNA-binding NtrC family response regulator